MFFHLLANTTVLIHFAFILLVVFGGLLVFRRKKMLWLHLPALIWGVWIEWSGRICPLTPLENYFRIRAGQSGYNGGFIEHYLLSIIYPEGLTRKHQILLGILLIGFNLFIYFWILRRKREKGKK